MGQVCSNISISKSVEEPRDPDDKEIDEIEMLETKISEFDAFFERAAGPLSKLVEMNNSIAASESNLKEAAAVVQGEAMIKLWQQNSNRQIDMALYTLDDKGNEQVLTPLEVEDKVSGDVDLREAYENAVSALGQLNADLLCGSSTSSRYEISKGRIRITSKGDNDAAIRSLNKALFKLRKQLMKEANCSRMMDAIQLFRKELFKNGITALDVTTDEESGKFIITSNGKPLDWSSMDDLSAQAIVLRDAVVDLVNNTETAALAVPGLAEETDLLIAEAQEFPAKAPGAAANSGLGLTEIPKSVKATATNVKNLSRGPQISKNTLQMIKYAGEELKEAVQIPIGG